MNDARFLTELRRYWDEIARGGPATPGALDPDLAATIRRLHALPDVPPPDPAFANRLEERFMQATTIPLPLADPRARPGLNGRSAGSARPWTLPPAIVKSCRVTLPRTISSTRSWRLPVMDVKPLPLPTMVSDLPSGTLIWRLFASKVPLPRTIMLLASLLLATPCVSAALKLP